MHKLTEILISINQGSSDSVKIQVLDFDHESEGRRKARFGREQGEEELVRNQSQVSVTQ